MQKLIISFFLFSCIVLSAQKETNNSYIDFNYFRGNIALHNNDILHLINNHPEGFIFSWNKKTFGNQSWEQRYGYPDYGVSFAYQTYNNDILGNNYALYAHYNFYFFRRHLMLRIAQGLAYNTNPYDKYTNPKNVAFGSDILSATYVMLNYKKERLFKRFGIQAGLTFTHYSNANIKAPNTSVNTMLVNAGLTYNLDAEDAVFKTTAVDSFPKKIKFNMAFRSGINQSDIVGSKQYPFYIFSGYADKRLSAISAVQFGTDVFFSNFLKELIYYRSIAFPEDEVSGDEDYKRVGVFLGHELFINRLSVISQLGYYVYYPYDFEGRTYIRVGLKRYFGQKIFGAVTLKSHGAKAEAVEFGLGIRL
ncbi:acyloxyacyl hydrolase [Winogradskyella eckloniae]|uniref:acyloxyacyl hydrolase n=1 Tax=Winogradskyella eckloniae TaxID=1089306 RepID=UPI001566A302|nr:acyloxyacyl hydrolase [Winogradskyella eckloniae]NRD21325.1 acyloxyacyl hydrolase [Winogradskyella eckloniae]